MAGTVVVGIDGSPNSAAALNWAVDEAMLRESPLHVVYALHMPQVGVPFGHAAPLPPSEQLKKYATAVLDSAAQRAVARARDIRVETELSLRPPADALIAASATASLVVVGTRGSGVLATTFLGSVSTRLASRSSCPTVVVPSGGEVRDAGAPIVLGVDGSPHSAAAARFALDEAARRGSRVVALNAYLFPTRSLPTRPRRMLEQFSAERRRQSAAVVTDVVERARDDRNRDVDVEIRLVDDHPADALAEAGRNASLTVVGSHGRGGFRGMLLGSVSQAVLHHSAHPVVLVHAPHGEGNA